MKLAYKLLIGVIVAALGLTAIFVVMKGADKSPSEDLGAAPDFTVNVIGGKSVSLKDFRGKPVVVNFWASWCPPCNEEAPVLAKVAQAYKGRVPFLGIVVQDTVANVKKFEKKFGIAYPNALDPKEAASRAYKVTGIPETFVIDAQGRLRGKWIGAIDEARLRQMIEEAQ